MSEVESDAPERTASQLRACASLALEVLLPVESITDGELAAVQALLSRALHGEARAALGELHEWRESQWRPGAAVLHMPRGDLGDAELLVETVEQVLAQLPPGAGGQVLIPLAEVLQLQGRVMAPSSTSGLLLLYGLRRPNQWRAVAAGFTAQGWEWRAELARGWQQLRHDALTAAILGVEPFTRTERGVPDRYEGQVIIARALGEAALEVPVLALGPEDLQAWCEGAGVTVAGEQVAMLVPLGHSLTLGQLVGLAAAVWR